MLGVKFLQDIRDTGSTFAGFGCQRTGALFEGNEHERSDGIFWAMDDDLLSGWFRTGERFKTILKFLCGPFLDVMIDIYCVTVPYIFFYISVCIFYAMRSILKYPNDSNVHVVFHADVLWWTNGTGMGHSCHPNVPDLYAWKVMEMIMDFFLIAYNCCRLYSLNFIIHIHTTYLCCANIISFANLVNTVYHLNYQPKCIHTKAAHDTL